MPVLLETETSGFGCPVRYLDVSLQSLVSTVSTVSRWRTEERQFYTDRTCVNVRPHCLRRSSRRVHRPAAGQSWTVRWEENTSEPLKQNKFLSLVTLSKLPHAPPSDGFGPRCCWGLGPWPPAVAWPFWHLSLKVGQATKWCVTLSEGSWRGNDVVVVSQALQAPMPIFYLDSDAISRDTETSPFLF